MADTQDTAGSTSNTNVEDILAQRGALYGDFSGHARITQELKDTVRRYNKNLNPIHQEALDMIMHKIGRILNGDPNYADSWVDIAGYAVLVEQRVKEKK